MCDRCDYVKMMIERNLQHEYYRAAEMWKQTLDLHIEDDHPGQLPRIEAIRDWPTLQLAELVGDVARVDYGGLN
jgi:hypothetical protein